MKNCHLIGHHCKHIPKVFVYFFFELDNALKQAVYNFRYRYILLLSTLDDRSENNSILGIGTSDSKFLAFFPVSVKFFRFFLKTRARFDDIQIQKNNLRIKTKVGLLMRERSKRNL